MLSGEIALENNHYYYYYDKSDMYVTSGVYVSLLLHNIGNSRNVFMFYLN